MVSLSHPDAFYTNGQTGSDLQLYRRSPWFRRVPDRLHFPTGGRAGNEHRNLYPTAAASTSLASNSHTDGARFALFSIFYNFSQITMYLLQKKTMITIKIQELCSLIMSAKSNLKIPGPRGEVEKAEPSFC